MTRFLLLFPLLLLTACATTIDGGHGLEYAFHRDMGQGPLTASALQFRLADAANKHRESAPTSRITYAALEFPEGRSEYDAMKGFGLLWVTALSRDESELPLKNLRLFTHHSGIVYLNSVANFNTRETDPRIIRTMGPYRYDGVFLVPIYQETLGSKVVADFQNQRDSFLIATVSSSPPAGIGQLSSIKNGGIIPDGEAIVPMLGRAFPILKEVALRQKEQDHLKQQGLFPPPDDTP
jgi:hypothetical protein